MKTYKQQYIELHSQYLEMKAENIKLKTINDGLIKNLVDRDPVMYRHYTDSRIAMLKVVSNAKDILSTIEKELDSNQLIYAHTIKDYLPREPVK